MSAAQPARSSSPVPSSSGGGGGICSGGVAWLYLLVFLDTAAAALTYASLPGRVIALGGDAATVGLLATFGGALQLLGAPALGRLGDRIQSPRAMLVLGCLAAAAGCTLAGLPLLPALFVARSDFMRWSLAQLVWAGGK
jgi:MFS family permease